MYFLINYQEKYEKIQKKKLYFYNLLIIKLL